MPQEVHPLLVPELAQMLEELTVVRKKQAELFDRIDTRLRLYGFFLRWDDEETYDFAIYRVRKKDNVNA